MSFLHSIVSVPMEWLIATGIVVAGLLALWLSSIFGQRRFITIKRSEETEVIIFHLRRIADAAERLATPREPQPSVNANTTNSRTGVPMFSR